MELKPGYKQTQVGMIPEDWEIIPLGEVVAKFKNGGTPSTRTKEYWTGNIPWITGNDIVGQKVSEIRRYITREALQNSSTNIIEEGNLLLVSRTGVGKLALAPCDIAISQDFTGVYPNGNKLNTKYLFHFLDHNRSILVGRNQGTSILGITRDTLSGLTIFFPPTISEQQAIAEALSDADALIDSLEQLIAKKRQIKQGAMQELLTGKKRLPGFEGEWEEKSIGSLGIFQSGSGFPIIFQGETEGDFPFFKVSDMNNEGNSTFMINANNWISINSKQKINARTFPKNSVIFAKIGAAIFLERKKILSQESCLDNNMMGFIIDSNITHYRYIHYLFKTINLGKLVSSTALPSLNGRDIGKLVFSFPCFDEQTTIVEVLNDMDAEIAALELKLAKTLLLKQGMMQELLTGRIRLI